MNGSAILENTAYFLALINPASKILLLSSMQPPYSWRGLVAVSLRSTLVALVILATLTVAGQFLLTTLFHVEIYSLKVAGGVVLFAVGMTAVRRGRFYEENALASVPDISVVPLAAPLIAGPGTIAGAISYSALNGVPSTLLCLALALTLNLLIMLTSLQVGHTLEKANATGPLIRITGLIVMAVAVQMILSGCGEWLRETLV